jgi:hypothetical protein
MCEQVSVIPYLQDVPGWHLQTHVLALPVEPSGKIVSTSWHSPVTHAAFVTRGEILQ